MAKLGEAIGALESDRAPYLVAGALVALFLGLGIDGARRDAPTVDEFAHLPAGAALLRHGSFDLYRNNPPLARAWMALPVVLVGAVVPAPGEPTMGDPRPSDWEPWLYGQQFMVANRERYLGYVFLARLAVLALATAGAVLLFAWARFRHGPWIACGALALYTLCPNLQAHGRLATTDAAFTAAVVGLFFALDRYAARPGAKRLLLCGAVLGLAMLTKFTTWLLLPAVWVVLAIASLPPVGDASRRRLGRAIGVGTARTAAVVAIAVAVVNLGMAFHGSGRSLGGLGLQSHAGARLAGSLPGWLPVPLPLDYVAGFDEQLTDTERGEFRVYFHGQWWRRTPPTYHLAALVTKLPLATLALLLWGAAAALRPPWNARGVVVWLPPLLLFAALSGWNALPGGIRYLLPALPFLFLGAAAGLLGPIVNPGRQRWRNVALGVLAVGLALASLAAHPRQLAFFNRLAGGTEGGHRWLLDSNLDWGQDLSRVPAYLAFHGISKVYLLYFGHVEPELYGIDYALPPALPTPGTYVVSANFALGAEYAAPDHWTMGFVPQGAPAWLRARTPDDRIGASLWVYHVR